MKRLLGVAGGLGLACVLSIGLTGAQTINETMQHRLNNHTTESFGCAAACTSNDPEQPCNLWNRIYGDKGPLAGVNDPATGTSVCQGDGFPRFGAAAFRYFGDGFLTANYPGINSVNDACEAWYSIWDGVTTPGSGTFISYYGASSTIINPVENGFPNCPACVSCTGGTLLVTGACFGALSSTSTTGSAIDNTPLGTISPIGGLAPIPVVLVTMSDIALNTLTLHWNAFNDTTTVNQPSSTSTPCPAGSTFNDLADANGPNPIRGLRLFVHTEPEVGTPRSLTSLEGAALIDGSTLDAFGNLRQRICFASDSGQPAPPPGECPDSHVIPCNGTVGGACAPNGIDFAPGAQTIMVSETAVNAALGADGPIASNAIVFNTKIVYAGATQTASTAGAAALNPKLLSVFSANSVKAGFGGLVSGVQFDEAATVVRGNRITLTWTAVGTFTEFRLQRGFDSISWTDIATIPATGAPSYAYTDEIRGRSASRVFYRVVASGDSGSTQALTEVSLRPGGRR